MKNDRLEFLFKECKPSSNLLVSELLARQGIIRDRIQNKQFELLEASKNKKLGVCLDLNKDTAIAVPYLAHLDFTKQIREFSDMLDYVVLNLAPIEGCDSAGIKQFYFNDIALEKLLKTSV